METFGFLLHPLNIKDIAKKYKIAEKVSPKVVASVLRRRRPFVLSEITGIKSLTGAEAMGWFVAVPLLPYQILELDEEYVIEKIVKATEIARKEGAKIVGLGAFTALVGNGGKETARRARIPVTTGNTYTVVTAIEATLKAAKLMGLEVTKKSVAIVGATGSIGSACAEVLTPIFKETILIGRDEQRLNLLRKSLETKAANPIIVSTDVTDISQADVIISVTGTSSSIIEPEMIKTGAVVCDVARPRDVSERVSQVRNDVLVIDGGIIEVPGPVQFNFDFGLPRKTALACMAETMILALEKRYESYTLGKSITVEMLKEMSNLAQKHGFKLAGFRSFEKAISKEEVFRIQQMAQRNRQILA
jgi:predicted amino acid dehydrogenase